MPAPDPPMTPTPLEALIARLEAATGPDRELDRAIFLALRNPVSDKRWGPYHGLRAKGAPPDPEGFAERFSPKYTMILDAALSLVPEGLWWMVGTGKLSADEPLYGVRIMQPIPASGFDDEEVSCAEHDASSALAMCIAALRARAALPRDTTEGMNR